MSSTTSPASVAAQVYPLRFPANHAIRKSYYGLKIYFAANGYYCFEKRGDGWQIRLLITCRGQAPDLHNALIDSGITTTFFQTRREATAAVESFVAQHESLA